LSMPFELMIGLRYLKAKRKSTFISIITFISTAGVTLGVMALIVVLAVMTGFERDLKEKILGTNAHPKSCRVCRPPHRSSTTR